MRDFQGYNAIQEESEKCDVYIDLKGLKGNYNKKMTYYFSVGGNNTIGFNSQHLLDVFNNWDEIKKIIPKIKVAKALEEGNNEYYA